VLVLQPSEKYKRRRPETILLYQLVKQYYLDFAEKLAEQGRYLTKYVKREYDEFLRYVDLNTVFVESFVFTTLQRMFIRELVSMHRQKINLYIFENYQDDFTEMLINALRLIRISVTLCTLRCYDTVPKHTLAVSEYEGILTLGNVH
jgi:hypothetical protein